MPQPLSSKEASLFRTVIRNYEDKQYKRGLKAAEQILKKNPKHGDTMAMKALIMNAQGRTDEAFALAKDALKVDMKSHICWHVYGLLYRAQKNFEEAIKAYKYALRLEPESSQIQRDLAILQIQMRDYAGYIQSRRAMCEARPTLRQNWTALAIAYHLSGDLENAERVLNMFESTLKVKPAKGDIEHSEAILYKNTIIAETGDLERALKHLESEATESLDRLAYMELKADYLFRLGRKAEAAKAYSALLERNPDLAEYYNRLVESLEPEDDQARVAIYRDIGERHPRSDAARRLPLDFLTGDAFRDAARAYLERMLDKGVPSTFANLKHLYTDDFKRKTLQDLVNEYLAAHHGDSEGGAKSDPFRGEAAAIYYLAQHYNYSISQDLDKATELVERGIALLPKNTEFVMTKARILKHKGQTKEAAEAMDAARQLDLRDRCINSKCAKYLLRNNENERALDIMGLFTRGEATGGPLADLLDMQCVWFLTEDGEAWARRGDRGRALKRFHAVATVFDTWQEDQFDFHSFSLRKGQIRAYIRLVRWEDSLRSHPFYERAARGALKIYLDIFDESRPKPANGLTAGAGGPNGSATANGAGADEEDAAARKRAAKKARKEAQKLERELVERAAKADPNKGSSASQQAAADGKKVDDDILGLKLAATKDPLAEALKFLQPLLQFAPKLVEGQLLGFDVYLRRRKYLLALKCLKAAQSIEPGHEGLASRAKMLKEALEASATEGSDGGPLPPRVVELAKAELQALP